MRDREIAAKAGEQFNRISRAQLEALGCSQRAIQHRVEAGRLVITEEGVFAIAPVLDDDWGRWMGATLTQTETHLSHLSAACAYGMLEREGPLTTVTRTGWGGPRQHGGLLAYRRLNLAGEVGELRGIPITCPERTLLDLAPHLSHKALARALRQAIRLELTTLVAVMEFVLARPRRRGVRKLARACARYSGLPLERARSGAEVQALLVFRDAGYMVPELNRKVAGEEADLRWPALGIIVEVDGDPFHQDVGEDARKEALWRAAGEDVRRISSDDVYERPRRLLALVPEAAPVPEGRA